TSSSNAKESASAGRNRSSTLNATFACVDGPDRNQRGNGGISASSGSLTATAGVLVGGATVGTLTLRARNRRLVGAHPTTTSASPASAAAPTTNLRREITI